MALASGGEKEGGTKWEVKQGLGFQLTPLSGGWWEVSQAALPRM